MTSQARNPGRTASESEGGGRFGLGYFVLGILLFAYLVCALLSFNPTLHTGGDNAHYMILARSMLSGKGYRDIYKPGEPLHTLYPFGYPLLLVPVMGLFRNSFIALKVLSLVLGAGSLAVVYLLLKDSCSKLLLYSVVGLFALSPLLLEYSHWILSDVSFTFFSLLGLLLARKMDSPSRRFPSVFWLALLCVVFAYYIRPVGVALILAILIHLLLRKQFRRFAVALAVFAVLLVPWSARTSKVSGREGYVAPMVLKNPYDMTSGRIGWSDIVERVKLNGEVYFLSAIPRNVITAQRSIWTRTRGGWVATFVGLAVSALVLLGFAGEVKRRMGFVHFYVIFYMGTLLIWPQVWATDRFILPLVPLLLYYFLKGGLVLFTRARQRLKTRAGLSAVAVLALGSLILVARSAPGSLRLMREYAVGNRMAGYTADWITFYETASYASRFTPPDAVFMVRKPALFYLFAERKCVAYPFTSEVEAIMATMRENGVSYVVVDAFAWTQTTRRYLLPAIVAHEDQFDVLYTTRQPRAVVLRFTGG